MRDLSSRHGNRRKSSSASHIGKNHKKRVYGNLGIGITIALLTVHLSFLTCLLTRNIADISCRSSAAIGSLRSLSHLNSLRRNQMTKSRSYANLSGKREKNLFFFLVSSFVFLACV